jgi:hypothetical protein
MCLSILPVGAFLTAAGLTSAVPPQRSRGLLSALVVLMVLTGKCVALAPVSAA